MANGIKGSLQELEGKYILMAWPKRASGTKACLLKTVRDSMLILKEVEVVHKGSIKVMTDQGDLCYNRTAHKY
jgi:hypothetical protein